MCSRLRLRAVWLAVLCLLVPSISALAQTVLAVPGRTNATPSIAAEGQFVAVVWGAALPGGATDVFLAVSRDGGRAFGSPSRVNHVPGDARLNGEQPPHVALVHRADRDPSVVVVWTTKGKNGTTLLQSRSDDAGRSFSAAVLVPGSDAAGNRGWEAIAVEPGGRIDAVWLDHRELASDSTMATSHHDHAAMVAGKASDQKSDGVAMAQKSKLFFAPIDGSAPARALTGGVCYCCKTALVTGPGGAIYAAWRHVYPGNLRDMAFTMSRDGGRTFAAPIRVSEDQWLLEGCPDDGPAMAVDAQQRIHVVWPTLVKDEERDAIALFYATSADGKTFSARQRIPAGGTPHHPRIVAGADGALTIAWDEAAGGKRRIAIAGVAQPFRAAEGVYPVLAATDNGVVAAWTDTSAPSSIRVAQVGAR